MSGTFYRTYRPQLFNELVGQDLIRLTLQQSIKDGRPAHAYLFTGPRGTGKTTTARILAKAVNCVTPLSKRKDAEPCNQCSNCGAINDNQTLDIVEIDAASYTGVDNIRQLTENVSLAPAKLKYKVFIIDEVHMLSKGAFNALLKTLEEPPGHAIFILATTEQHKVPATITSRCQRFSFYLLTIPDILKKLKTIAKKEKLIIGEDSLQLIAEAARGGMRDAESLLAQIATLAGSKINLAETVNILGISQKEDELKILEDTLSYNVSSVFEQIEKANASGIDFSLLAHNLLEYLRQMLFLKVNPQGEKILKKEMSEKQAEKLLKFSGNSSPGTIIDLATKIIQSQLLIKNSSLPHLAIELTLIGWILSKDVPFATNKSASPKGKPPKNDSMVPPNQKEEAKKNPPRKNDLTKKKGSQALPQIKKGGKKENTALNINLKIILNSWTKILQNIKNTQPALFSLLKVCSPVRVEDETLVISTPFKFHKDRISDGRNRDIFCAELDKITGLKKICVVEDDKFAESNAGNKDLMEQVKNLL
jgi:DNA polymerase-3 subunit gamma/tau